MKAGRGRSRSAERPPDQDLAFRLERFAWAAPDRLRVIGELLGSSGVALEETSLVVHADDRVHRLPISEDDQREAAPDGAMWDAAFTWHEPPFAFGAAELHLGPDLVFALPQPDAGPRREPLFLSRLGPGVDGHPSGAEEGHAGVDEHGAIVEVDASVGWPVRDGGSSPDDGREGQVPGSRVLETELRAARTELDAVNAVVRRTQKELEAAREELEDSRRRHAAESERFNVELAAVRATAHDAHLLERQAAEENTGLRAALAEAREDADRFGVQAGQLEAAAIDARAEADSLRELLERVRAAVGEP